MSIDPPERIRISFLRAASPALLLVYFVVVGGSSIGELDVGVRAANMALTLGLIAVWAVVAAHGTDRIDLAATVALLLFLVACVTSEFLRQSFGPAWLAAGYLAAFALARRALADRRARRLLLVAMVSLSLVFASFTALRWLPDIVVWLTVTGWQFPPLDLPFESIPWGHRHDLTLLLVLLLPAWLGLPKRRAIRVLAGAACALTVLIVVLDGSRAVWVAILAASVAVVGRAAWPRIRSLPRKRVILFFAILAAGFGVAVIAGAGDRVFNLRTLLARSELWANSYELWLNRPLVGHGPGSFPWLLQLTTYFDTNSWAPRHPDSAPFQLLAEVGLVGVLAVGAMTVAIWRSLWKEPRAAWAITCFAVAAIAGNPTDFGFLIAIGVAWTAYAMPYHRPAIAGGASHVRRRFVPVLVGIALMPIAVGMIIAVRAEWGYDAAGSAVANGRLQAAEQLLEESVAADPSMSLYHRSLGLVRWASHGASASLSELNAAVVTNPADDFSFRILAVADWAAGQHDSARQAIAQAVHLQRSDSNNMLLAAKFAADEGQHATALELVAEVAQANPQIVLAPGWNGYLRELQLENDAVVRLAAQRWERHLPSTQPVTVQGLWLSVMSGRIDLVSRAQHEAPFDPGLAVAVTDVLQCDNAAAMKHLANSDALRETYYWAVRSVLASSHETRDRDAERILSIMTGSRADPGPIDSLDENTPPGFGKDQWGYRRRPIRIGGLASSLPSPSAGGFAAWAGGAKDGNWCDASA